MADKTDGELAEALFRIANRNNLFNREDRRLLIQASHRIARVKKKKLAVTRFSDPAHLLDFVNTYIQPEDVVAINDLRVSGGMYHILWFLEDEQ